MSRTINRDPRHYPDRCHDGCGAIETPKRLEATPVSRGFYGHFVCACGETWTCWFAYSYMSGDSFYSDCPCTACFLGRNAAGLD